MSGFGPNATMNYFKRAALTNVAVQANSGLTMHSSHADGQPITYNMVLNFTEVDLVLREDHACWRCNWFLMATPNFFKNLPNVKYSMSVDSAGNTDDVTIKDYYRLMRLTDQAFRETTLYNEYIIKEGQRPDQIAYEVYGDSQYYWVILLVNNIIDVASEWPLSNEELENYMIQKYGSLEAAQKTHHWETEEVKDDTDSVILEAGLEVNKEFVFYYYPNPTENAQVSSQPYSRHLCNIRAQTERRQREDRSPSP